MNVDIARIGDNDVAREEAIVDDHSLCNSLMDLRRPSKIDRRLEDSYADIPSKSGEKRRTVG